jgi:hypothetical protein
MGCDIHLYVERRTASGAWERVRPMPRFCHWCNGTGEGSRNGGCYFCDGVGKTTREYHDRNYDLFGMLANVRNGSGFAGVRTGSGFEPLSEPRGLPDDTSIKNTPEESDSTPANRMQVVAAELAAEKDRVWLGEHSHSHATLAELLAYDYARVIKHEGLVTADEFARWDEAGATGAPEEYCGDVWGDIVVKVTNEEMRTGLASGRISAAKKKPGTPPPAKAYYTRVEWTETYRESAGPEWFSFLESCLPLGKPEDIRFVFGFDS